MQIKMNKEFEQVAKIYLPKTAIPLNISEHTHRGCKLWIFQRKIKKFRPTGNQLWRYHKGELKFKDIPEKEKEYFIDEYWMGISDYFTKFDCEFEETVEKKIGSNLTQEEALWRLKYFIDKDYAKLTIMEDII